MDKIIITAALTGGIHTKEVNAALPEQPPEIIQDAYDCYNAGAAIVHLHARDEQGNGVGDCRIFSEINKGSIVFFAGREKKEIKFFNLRSEIEAFSSEMLRRGVKPEMEVYNPSMFGEVENLIARDLIKKPYYVNLVMGVEGMGGFKGTPDNFVTMKRMLPAGSICNVTGIGKWQMTMNVMAIISGCHTRVGLEDNVYYRKGELAKSNAHFVERVARIAREIGREIASPDEARKILELTL